MYERRQNMRICMTIDNILHQIAWPADLLQIEWTFLSNLKDLGVVGFFTLDGGSHQWNMQQQLFEWPSQESFCSNQKREKPIHPYWHLCNLSTHLKKGGTFKGNWSTLYSFKGTEIGDNWTYFAPIWSFSFVKAELQMYLLVTTWGPLPHSWCLDIIPHLWNWFKQSNLFDNLERSNNFGFPFYIS